MILLSTVLFFPNFHKIINKKLGKLNITLTTVFCYLIGFVLLISGSNLITKNPSYIARKDKIDKENQEVKAKKDEENRIENEKNS